MTLRGIHGQPSALLRVTGEDAFDYLQSQFSNDLRSPLDKACTYGLWLDRKGRVQADSFVLQLDEETFLLVSYQCEAPVLVAHLEARIIADDVEIEALSGELLSVTGDIEADFSKGWPGEFPPPKAFVEDVQLGYLFRGRGLPGLRLDCLKVDGAFIAPKEVNLVDPLEFEALRIEAGIAAVPTDCGLEGDLPQEAALEKEAVAFDKGCYLGQEVMARLHAMGQVRRGLFRIGSSGPTLATGQSLFREDRAVGEVRSVHPTPREGGVHALALLKLAHVSPGTELALQAGGTPEIRVL
ncbi:MAG: YgfZ/GcvT domain-containing protein [Opitutales bacterium]